MRFGPWIVILFRLLACFNVLRGTPLDIFGYSHHRRLERSLIAEYEQTVGGIVASLTIENHAEAVEIAGLAARIRAFDTVKEAIVAAVRLEVSRRLTLLHKSAITEV